MSKLQDFFTFGRVGNVAHQSSRPLLVEPEYVLAFVEFDDQGWYHDLNQRAQLYKYLDANAGVDHLVIGFVHGWKHNASTKDQNLHSFQKLLHEAYLSEQERKTGRKVLGVYLGWRGLSNCGNFLWQDITFWTRKSAAFRVAIGSVREVLARLKAFRDASLASAAVSENDGHEGDSRGHLGGTRLILAGHSFGGLVLFSAVAEYLIESTLDKKVIAPFGDLIILVNPAFEATRYVPIRTALAQRGGFQAGQRPVFVEVTAEDDWATGWAFPIGRWLNTRFEAVRPKALDPPLPEDAQRQANLNTMGHLDWLTTHELRGTKGTPPPSAQYTGRLRTFGEEDQQFRSFNVNQRPAGQLVPHWERTYSAGAKLRHLGRNDPNDPFWIVRATKDIVHGHNGIFGLPFLDFLRQLVDDRLRQLP